MNQKDIIELGVIDALIKTARGPGRYARFDKGGLAFSAERKKFSVSLFLDGVRIGRMAAKEKFKSLANLRHDL